MARRGSWGREALLGDREGLEGPPGGTGGFGMTIRRARQGRDAHLEDRETFQLSGRSSRPLPSLWNGLPTPPGPPKGTPDLSWLSRPHQDLQKRLLTPPCPPQGPQDLSLPSGRASQLLPPLSRRPPDPSQPSGRNSRPSCPCDPSRPLQALLEGLTTPPGPCVGIPTPPCSIERASKPPGHPNGPPDPSRPSGRAFQHRPAL